MIKELEAKIENAACDIEMIKQVRKWDKGFLLRQLKEDPILLTRILDAASINAKYFLELALPTLFTAKEMQPKDCPGYTQADQEVEQ